MLGRRGALRFLAVPPFLWLGLFFVVPLVLVVAISFRPESGPIDFDDPWTVSLSQYRLIFETPAYLRLLGVSILMAESHLAAATRIGDRLYAIDRGEIIFHGPPKDALADEKVVRALRG